MDTQIGFKFIDRFAGQGQAPQVQTPANSNAPTPQAANSDPSNATVGSRPARYRGAQYSSTSPINLFFNTASEPLLPSQATAVAPKTFKEYSTQWDAWKNEAHPINENRSEAVQRMEYFLKREILLHKAHNTLLAVNTYGVSLLLAQEIPPSRPGTALDLSSLGLSSLPPWLPRARKVNLDHNNLTSVPENLTTHLACRRKNVFEIRLANNPIPPNELNKLQNMIDSPDYLGPKLVLPREGQRYEPPQEVLPS